MNIYQKLTLLRYENNHSAKCFKAVTEFLFDTDLTAVNSSIDLMSHKDYIIISWNRNNCYINLEFDKHGYHKMNLNIDLE